MKQLTILDLIDDPALEPWFRDKASWEPWRAFLGAFFALPLSAAQRAICARHTGRMRLPEKPCRSAYLVCGRRSGKSFIMALIATYLSCFRDWRPWLAPGELATIMVVARDRDQAASVLRYIKEYFAALPMLSPLVQSETAEELLLTNRVRIRVNSASATRTRGYAIAVCIADELAHWPTSESSAAPDVEVLAAVRPGMAQFPDSILLAASSPYAKRGELYEGYRRHYGQDDDPVLCWQATTRDMNATVPQEYIDAELERDPAKNRAEYLAEWRDDVAGFVPRDVVLDCIEIGRRELPFSPAHRYTGGVDPSGGVQDSFTLAISHREGERSILDMTREWRPPFDPESVVDDLVKDLKRYRISEVTGDKYAAGWCEGAFRKRGIRYIQSERNRTAIYRDALPLLMAKTVVLLDDQRLVHQLCSLERRLSKSGIEAISHPEHSGSHDDLANSVCLALTLTASKPVRRPDSRPIINQSASRYSPHAQAYRHHWRGHA